MKTETNTPKWSILKAGETIETSNNLMYRIDISKNIHKDKPSILLTSGSKTLDGYKPRYNIVMPSTLKEFKEKVLPLIEKAYTDKDKVKDTDTTEVKPSKDTLKDNQRLQQQINELKDTNKQILEVLQSLKPKKK